MSYESNAWPQDGGTGIEDTIDWVDAGGAAWHVHRSNTTGYIEDGFDVSVDWTNELATVSEGVAVIEQSSTQDNDHTGDGGDPQKQLIGASFKVQRGPSGDLNLEPGHNEVWVGVDQTQNNVVNFYHSATGVAPGVPHLKICDIYTDEQSIVRPNDNPTATFDALLLTPGGDVRE